MQSQVESIYNALIEYSRSKYAKAEWRGRRQFRKWESLTTAAAIVILALACLAGLATSFSQHLIELRALSLVLVLIAQIVAVVRLWLPAFEYFISLRYFSETFLRSSSEKTEADYDFSARLLDCDDVALKFVAKRIRSETDHFRFRIGTFVGPLEKLGVLPIAASICLTVWKLNEPNITDNTVFWVIIGYVIACFCGALLLLKSHRLEELAQIVELASEMKGGSGSDSANSHDTP